MATTITLSEHTKNRLNEVGRKGSSYDEIVNYLISYFVETKQVGDTDGTGGGSSSS